MAKKSLKKHNLKIKYPALAKQWNYSRNKSRKPERYLPSSKETVWWICENGHEWKRKIYYQIRKHTCPKCKVEKVSLAKFNPGLAREWHPTKNGKLTPKDVTSKSGKKVWWKCAHNHEWQAIVKDRAYGSGCPYCSNKKACKDNSLAKKYPAIAREWHPTKNGEKTPDDFTARTQTKVWWLCKKGHSWKAAIGHRTRGSGCPYCSNHKVCSDNSLAATYPAIAKEWHPTKNGTLTPDKVFPGSVRKVWWLCSNGHEWHTAILTRKSGRNCPRCPRPVKPEKSLAKMYPSIAAQWHPVKNGTLTPETVHSSSYKKVWWQCEHGHEWLQYVYYRHRHRECPLCRKERLSLAGRNPDLAAEWHPTKNGKLTPKDVTPFKVLCVWWKCKEKGHVWRAVIRNRALGKGCPKCRVQGIV